MRWRFRVVGVLVLAAALVSGCTSVVAGTPAPRSAQPSGGGPVDPAVGHPRLFVKGTDLDRLRSWATPANPVWAEGLSVLATTARATMDAGTVPAQDEGL